MHELYHRAEFGDYFGGNWDAMIDCLCCDYDYSNLDKVILVFRNYLNFEKRDPETANDFLQVFRSAIESLREIGIHDKLFLVVVDE